MTRINVIPPSDLTDQHLIAEYRELPRVFKLAAAALAREGSRPAAPQAYTLGRGHERFFYLRTLFLNRRQTAIIAEMQARGVRTNYPTAPTPVVGLDDDWTQDAAAIEVNLSRLRSKLREAKRPYTYGGERVGVGFYGGAA